MTNVYLTPEAGTEVATLCERAAADLSARQPAVSALADDVHRGWLGDCEEGRGWARLLQDKATGSNSLRWLVEQHVANLMTIAERYRQTIGGYAEADRAVSWR